MAFETIRYEVERGRARITLDRPEKRNALSRQLQRELHTALWDADDDPAVHCVILRGAGTSFSGGYDLAEGHGSDGPRSDGHPIEQLSYDMEYEQRLRMAIFDLHKPVLCGIHGFCIAGGTDIALLCDIIIAAEDAQIGFPPVRDMGIPPHHMWLYHVGPQWAKRFLLTGDLISGADAAKIGLVLKAVPAADLDAELDLLADRMAQIDVTLLGLNKRMTNLGLELMGARTLQRLAAEFDARANLAPSSETIGRRIEEVGIREAIRERDARFGNGRIEVGVGLH
jgi:enoyl-CoA hydratase